MTEESNALGNGAAVGSGKSDPPEQLLPESTSSRLIHH